MSELVAAFEKEGFEISPRLVRHLISEGIMDNPDGGRSNADYQEKHVAQLRRYLLLKELGWSLSSIRSACEGIASLPPFTIAPGILLVIDPERIDLEINAAAIEKLTAEVLRILKQFSRKATVRSARAKEPV